VEDNKTRKKKGRRKESGQGRDGSARFYLGGAEKKSGMFELTDCLRGRRLKKNQKKAGGYSSVGWTILGTK